MRGWRKGFRSKGFGATLQGSPGPPGVFYYEQKIAFLIDRLNFYYSVKRLKAKTNLNAKWFDYISFCDFYKLELSKRLSEHLSINGIFYFTSLIVKTSSMSESAFQQHRTNQVQYLKILSDQGITFLKGKFNQKQVKCP